MVALVRAVDRGSNGFTHPSASGPFGSLLIKEVAQKRGPFRGHNGKELIACCLDQDSAQLCDAIFQSQKHTYLRKRSPEPRPSSKLNRQPPRFYRESARMARPRLRWESGVSGLVAPFLALHIQQSTCQLHSEIRVKVVLSRKTASGNRAALHSSSVQS
jgi:hypothetical protein